MSPLSLCRILFAETEIPGRVVYELARLRSYDDSRLAIALTGLAVAAIVALVWYLYRRDTQELSRGVRLTLASLRFIALAGLLVYFLGVERRTTREVVHNSQVAVLIDVSQSMALADEKSDNRASRSRLETVVDVLEETPLIAELRQDHDVNFARFDENVQSVVSLPRLAPPASADAASLRNVDDRKAAAAAPSDPLSPQAVDWSVELAPRGVQTRLGEALAEQLYRYRAAPLAGIILVSDGVQNAGAEPIAAVQSAREAGVPIYTIGVGSTDARKNLTVSDFLVPARAFPGDTVNISGFIQATGYKGQIFDAQLLRRASNETAATGTVIDSKRVEAGADGEVVPVSFDVEPDAPGKFVYQLRIAAPVDDDNLRDNSRESELDIVDQQTRVLLIASGPTREYRFLRDQLHRDRTMKIDVLLQTAQPGISQDAENILDDFPATREELYEYDCIVAFDPDWTQLDAAQVDLLQSWVADEAGGMIVLPGPIHTARWVRSVEHAKLRDLYPVVFQQRFTLLDDGHFGGEAAWPLDIDRVGRDARFLWLANTGDESAALWSEFPGIYGYYAVKAEKPGATVYMRVADRESTSSGKLPVYVAGQFFGAGQVLYIGSGEFWRLRALDPAYFEVLYTKLVRHVSQGRLLRGSSRGALLVDRERFELGETIVVRARLSDERHEPLAVESVTAQLGLPDQTSESVTLKADHKQAGMFIGQFIARQEGTYQIALTLTGSNAEPLAKYIQVRVPDLERIRPQRNEPMLAGLAQQTGGRYYSEFELAAAGNDDTLPLAKVIPSRMEMKLLKGAPDKKFAETQMKWLLGVIAGALFLEWILRRLNRLA